jgi:hypothetical protein
VTHDVQPADEPGGEVHHAKPKHLAEKVEGYIGVAMVVAALVILVVVAIAFMNAGSERPSWIH